MACQLLAARVLPVVAGILLGAVLVLFLYGGRAAQPPATPPPAALPLHFEARGGQLHMLSQSKPRSHLLPAPGRLPDFPA